MSSQFLLRDYRESDIEAMFRLDEACFAPEFRFGRGSMRSYAEQRGAISLVVEDLSGRIAGFVIVHIERARERLHGYVVTLDVAHEHRREGLATRMLHEAEVRARNAGAVQMVLHVFTGNDNAIRFYERMGYRRNGFCPSFYGRAHGDAFEYSKALVNL